MTKTSGLTAWVRSSLPFAFNQAAPTEKKSYAGGAMFAFHAQSRAAWSAGDYATLSRVGYMRNPVVNRCVRMISEAAATADPILYRGDQALDEHDLLTLLNRPNTRQSGKTFMETIYGHLLVSGNAYVEMVKLGDNPRELHALRPDRVKVLVDAHGWPSGYEYTANRKTIRHLADDRGNTSVLHFSLFHPLDDQHGFPPLQAALMALDVHNAASQWNKSLLDNSARPSGALIYSSNDGANLSDEQFDRLKRELEEGYAGAQKAGRPLLLEGGLDWKAMSYSPRDMDFMQARNGAARDIALAFGVPPMLLGIPGDNTYANYREANRAFWRQTVMPLVLRSYDSLGHWFSGHLNEPFRLSFDADRIDGLSPEREALWQRINSADFLDDNEKRQAAGYSPRQRPAHKQGRENADE